MSHFLSPHGVHRLGESSPVSKSSSASWPVDTPGGRVHAGWCHDAPMTREGSLLFFFQFLAAGGRWAELVKSIPLAYHSNNASHPRDVIGTLLLSVLNGHWRYAHIPGVWGLAPKLAEWRTGVPVRALRAGEVIREGPPGGAVCWFWPSRWRRLPLLLRRPFLRRRSFRRLLGRGGGCGRGWR